MQRATRHVVENLLNILFSILAAPKSLAMRPLMMNAGYTGSDADLLTVPPDAIGTAAIGVDIAVSTNCDRAVAANAHRAARTDAAGAIDAPSAGERTGVGN